jgi:hypothetical protein
MINLSFRKWLLSEESSNISPHTLEALSFDIRGLQKKAFVYTIGNKYYQGSTSHEGLINSNYESLKKEYGDDLWSEYNDDVMQFCLIGRYSYLPLENYKNHIKDDPYRKNEPILKALSKLGADNKEYVTIVSFWNSNSDVQEKENSYLNKKGLRNTGKKLYDTLLIPCLNAMVNQGEKVFFDSDKGFFSKIENVFVAIPNEPLRPITYYVGGGSMTYNKEDEKDKTAEMLAFHQGRWPNGKVMTPSEKEELGKKLGYAPSAIPASDNNIQTEKVNFEKMEDWEISRYMKKIIVELFKKQLLNPSAISDGKMANSHKSFFYFNGDKEIEGEKTTDGLGIAPRYNMSHSDYIAYLDKISYGDAKRAQQAWNSLSRGGNEDSVGRIVPDGLSLEKVIENSDFAKKCDKEQLAKELKKRPLATFYGNYSKEKSKAFTEMSSNGTLPGGYWNGKQIIITNDLLGSRGYITTPENIALL